MATNHIEDLFQKHRVLDELIKATAIKRDRILVDLRKEGVSIRKISEETGLARPTIDSRVRRYNEGI